MTNRYGVRSHSLGTLGSGSYQARPKQPHLGSQEGYLLASELPPPAPRAL